MRQGTDAALSILAGGRGSRLGGVAKGLLLLGGRSLLARQLEELSPLFEEIRLVTPDPAPYAAFGLEHTADVIPDKGAPGGVHAALCAARAPWVVAIACDMPFVTRAVVRVLLDARDDATDAVCFRVRGRLEPLLATYRTALAGPWGQALESNPSFRELLAGFRTKVLPEEALRAVDPGLAAVESLNSPEDLDRHGASMPSGA